VIVPVLSEENLTELNFLREKLEPKLIRLATKRATPADIEGLREIDLELDRAITSGDINAYLRQNYQFHKTLYKLADAHILEQIADILWLLYGPSLRVVCGRIGTLNLTDQHKETLNAMSEGDGQRAADAIRADVTQGIDQIRHSMLNS
jgi:DNA-binding GntR family transcriptional regulator